MTNLPLPDHGKFYDLNVPYDNSARDKLQMLVKLGYEVIAFTNYLQSSTTASKSFFFLVAVMNIDLTDSCLCR